MSQDEVHQTSDIISKTGDNDRGCLFVFNAFSKNIPVKAIPIINRQSSSTN